MLKTSLFAGAFALLVAAPAFAEIEIHDSYARSASPTAQTGAAFMMIRNTGTEADRLIGASSDVAARTELHTHLEGENGVMRMVHVEEGFELPAEGEIAMVRGGKHVMLMGLNDSLEQGETVTITLTFEKAGDIVVDVPVDLERQDHGGMMDHGNMNQSGN
ncbi:copper chaperone PCu(A)C [uncultured Marivita sp.]|uniref:copper chaperone PCu(A)C n=1 Tax=uncultured Marivita sp. TaxID=888080 RepID=UPI002627443A|nr:copper chaperone PCu(A)C [uncultured Marivita sp.]